jgi:hypothetical protein
MTVELTGMAYNQQERETRGVRAKADAWDWLLARGQVPSARMGG